MTIAAAFDVEAATRAYLAGFSGAARLKSDAYFEGGYWLLLWNAVVGGGIAWGLLHFGVAARLSAWASRTARGRRGLATWLWAIGFLILTTVISLPWTIYTDFVREHQYGMSTQNFAQWAGDFAKSFAIATLFGSVLLTAVMAGVRRSPRRWWIYGGMVSVVVLMFVVAVVPVVIEPLFNTYKPMGESPLRTDILKLAQGSGVPVTNVFVVDASRQTTRVSANVAGLGPTARVALNDNLLNTHDDAGVLAVMGHEVGHYVLNHTVTLIIGFALVIAGGFIAVHVTVPRLIARFPRWRVDGIGDPAAIAVGVIVFTLYGLAMTPVTNNLTRFHEQQADIFGLNAARAPDGFARSAIRLGQYRKLEPTAFEEFVFFDHPSGRTRIHQAMQWKADHLSDPGVR